MTAVHVEAGAGAGAHSRMVVSVSYNGLTKEFEVESTASVQSLLAKAISAFGIHNQPHLLSLFTEAGVELPDQESLAAAGVTPGDKLLLRPGAVKGGT